MRTLVFARIETLWVVFLAGTPQLPNYRKKYSSHKMDIFETAVQPTHRCGVIRPSHLHLFFLQFVRFPLWDSQMRFVAFQDTSLERHLTWVCFCLTAIRAKALRMFAFGSTVVLEFYCIFTLTPTHFLELGFESAEADSCWVKRLKWNPLNFAPTSFWRSKSQSYFSLLALNRHVSHDIVLKRK